MEQCCAHARLLRTVLDLHRLHVAADCALSTVPQLALLLQLSETVARPGTAHRPSMPAPEPSAVTGRRSRGQRLPAVP